MTREEFDIYCQENDALSDLDYGYNPETEEFDVPSIEWDGPMGRHWERFETEEMRDEALAKYKRDLHEWTVNYRRKQWEERMAKAKEAERIENLKTIGGQNPELKELFMKMVEEKYG